MTQQEFYMLKSDAGKTDLSLFAVFCIETAGYEFHTKRGEQLDKWEVFCNGYHHAKNVIANKTDIVAKKKEKFPVNLLLKK